jgi:glutamate formiminotransferase
MNMTNYKKSPLFRVFETIKREAERYGVPVVGTEIIGMVPMQAMLEVAQFYLQLDDFDMNRIIESKILEILANKLKEVEQ